MRHASLILLLASITTLGAAQAPRAGASPDSAWWTRSGARNGIPAPTYQQVERRSIYVPMRDGVRLAVDVFLPKDLAPGTRLPTVMEQTRYRRSFEFTPEAAPRLDRTRSDVLAFVTRGYAYLVVDVRGSGASFGGRIAEFHRLEVEDGKDLVDWIVRQPWSDGTVGGLGISYVGSTADLLLLNRHPAVKAVAPTFAFYDAFADIVAPGGVLQDFFLKRWGELIREMDLNQVSDQLRERGVLGSRPVDLDGDRSLLRAAVDGHRANVRVDEVISDLEYRDDVGENGLTVDATSTHSFRAEQQASGAAIYSYSGWWDGGYPHSAIKRFQSVRTPGSRLILGPWAHGGSFYWTPGPDSARLSSFDRLGELVRFFDHHLRGTANGISTEPAIHYFTMGENRWKTSATWPVPGTGSETWFFGSGGSLGASRPTGAAGVDRYQVDTTVGTGETSRWNTLLGGGPVVYPNRAEIDRKLLTYTSAPLDAPLEVTGHPMVTLHVASTARDGAFFVYLEEVMADGTVAYVTEGILRASLRQVGTGPYLQVPPYRSLTRASAAPLVPGEPAELSFDLLPVSHQFRAGSRIRVAIAGADRDHFARIPAGEAPTVSVFRNSARASQIVLPVVR
ncbi:MAG: CocE/NonD family hydrolase [Gemmatimonadales bacterium]